MSSLRLLLMSLILLMLGNLVNATSANAFYRDFWFPDYHGKRLNYCDVNGSACGLTIANRYCKMLGYAAANQALIDYNLGCTNILTSACHCKGFSCNGFKKIRCVTQLSHYPPRLYHYRLKEFPFPRYQRERVDWCYDGRRNCGRRAAYSFCRRMGYLTARQYAISEPLGATKAIGNQKKCLGQNCRGFSYIRCYR